MFKYFTKIAPIYLALLTTVIIMFIGSCKKDDGFDTESALEFSTDTITFDTVFTTVGSSTQYFMIRNTSNKKINISQILLAGGENSNFRINIDGSSGVIFSDIEIEANDSLYAFVEVTVDPNNMNNPMLITDSILFNTNGNIQDVDLVAYGQDAYFILPNRSITGLPPLHIVAGEFVDTTWTADKPIVVYGYAVVDSNGILNIEAGTKIYFHNNSGLWVYKGGKIVVNGTAENPVVFSGDRLEDYYKNIPGQWDRIWLNEGASDNIINHAIIKNSFIGIQAETLQEDMGGKLKITNTRIENISGAGILARYYKIDAENLMVANCKQYSVALTMGGDYSFKHSTLTSYWTYSARQTPVVYMNNYYADNDNVVYPFDLTRADFINCIIHGNLDDEIVADNNSKGGTFNYIFDHCLVKSSLNTTNTNNWLSIIKNQSPEFESTEENDFHLTQDSPCKASGKAGVLATDIEGTSYDFTSPSLGAYQFTVSRNRK